MRDKPHPLRLIQVNKVIISNFYLTKHPLPQVGSQVLANRFGEASSAVEETQVAAQVEHEIQEYSDFLKWHYTF